MQFEECVKGRRSVRKFTEQRIDRTELERIVELASCSPSWKNTQIARYIVIEDEALKKRVADDCVMGFQYNSDTIQRAPALIVVTMIAGRCGFERDGSFSTGKGDRWEMFDAGIATQTLCLAAHAAGLGTVILGIFDEDKVHRTVNVPEGQKVAALVAIGHAAETPAMPKRKEVAELLSFR